MDSGLAGIIGAGIGGLIALVSGPYMQVLRERKHSRSLAAAFAGEIGAILEVARFAKPKMTFEGYLNELRSGADIALPFVIRDVKFEDVYRTNVANIGMLPDRLPRDVAVFYTLLFNMRDDLASVERGDYDSRGLETKIRLVEACMRMWDEIEERGRDLVKRLESV